MPTVLPEQPVHPDSEHRRTVEEIAKVPGFGGKAAADLKSFLEARSSVPSAEETNRS